MKYTITAKVDANSKANQAGNYEDVDAGYLVEKEMIKFWVGGDVGDNRRKDRTLGLCYTLVQAGYAEFEITYQEIQEE